MIHELNDQNLFRHNQLTASHPAMMSHQHHHDSDRITSSTDSSSKCPNKPKPPQRTNSGASRYKAIPGIESNIANYHVTV